ncbi:MAG: SDR family NAD(P)-dependent oxidoreductase [Ignavibacteriales bacterium]|nr:SDR family NAD(P)-dependent oxidoreductase [Ignavibacteriales bacterium]
MKIIVITGSTRGIGYGLADAFLKLGCSVAISGRTQQNVDAAVVTLSAKYRSQQLMGLACDVTRFEQVQALWNATKVRFGKIDIWINNAGVNAGRIPFWQLSRDHIQGGVETNLIGAMNGAVVAIGGMLQQGSGAVYNMEGLGSNGRKIRGLTLYGTTKYGLAYLTDALAGETRGTPVIVGAIRPGMVVTNLLTKPFEGKPAEWERAKRMFNLLAERVETVTPWIAVKVLANTKSGIRIQWLTPTRLGFCILRALFSKRDLFR